MAPKRERETSGLSRKGAKIHIFLKLNFLMIVRAYIHNFFPIDTRDDYFQHSVKLFDQSFQKII